MQRFTQKMWILLNRGEAEVDSISYAQHIHLARVCNMTFCTVLQIITENSPDQSPYDGHRIKRPPTNIIVNWYIHLCCSGLVGRWFIISDSDFIYTFRTECFLLDVGVDIPITANFPSRNGANMCVFPGVTTTVWMGTCKGISNTGFKLW